MNDKINLIKNRHFILLFLSAFFWVACNNQNSSEENNDLEDDEYIELATDTTQNSAQEDLYMCPMDCEDGEIYEAPGNCRICKMPYEKAIK